MGIRSWRGRASCRVGCGNLWRAGHELLDLGWRCGIATGNGGVGDCMDAVLAQSQRDTA